MNGYIPLQHFRRASSLKHTTPLELNRHAAFEYQVLLIMGSNTISQSRWNKLAGYLGFKKTYNLALCKLPERLTLGSQD